MSTKRSRRRASRPASRVSRRAFLGGVGAAIALPFLESLPQVARTARWWQTPVANAMDGEAKRAVFYYVPNGMNMDAWWPTSPGVGVPFSPTLAPLERHRRQIAVLGGLNNEPGTPTGAGDHAAGTGAFLTCTKVHKTEGSDIRNGISVDQRIANEIGYQTRFASLQLGGQGGASVGGCDSGYSCAYARNISWAGPQTPLPKVEEPQLVFDRLFSGYDPNQTDAEREARRTRRTSVLDVVLEDANALQGSLSGRDRQKLDEYMTSVRELETRIAEDVELACAVPGTPGFGLDVDARIDLMTELMVLALQCDQTRICSFMFGNAGSYRNFPNLGISESHHDLSHHQGLERNLSALEVINEWEISVFARLIDQLAAVDEGDGSTLLDHTTLFFSSEIADGDRHGHYDLPVLLAGGGWAGDRYTRFDGVPIANLFVSLMQHFGIEESTFGDDGDGALPGLR